MFGLRMSWVLMAFSLAACDRSGGEVEPESAVNSEIASNRAAEASPPPDGDDAKAAGDGTDPVAQHPSNGAQTGQVAHDTGGKANATSEQNSQNKADLTRPKVGAQQTVGKAASKDGARPVKSGAEVKACRDGCLKTYESCLKDVDSPKARRACVYGLAGCKGDCS